MLPNFLIIGAAKSGTSSLYHYLRQHPDVFMSELKEPKFFALEGEPLDYQGPDQGINRYSVTSLAEYEALFSAVKSERAIGEASPLYMHSEKAPGRIHHYLPQARLIAILRDPAERAFSSYCHLVRERCEPMTFRQGLEAEDERIRMKWSPLYSYRGNGRYFTQLQRFFEIFPRDRIRIILHEELDADSGVVVRDSYDFLGVDPAFRPEMPRLNISGVPKSRLLYNLFTKDNPVKAALKPFFSRSVRMRLQTAVRSGTLQKKPELDPETRAMLVENFREETLRLQDLIDRDLSAWL